MVHWSDEGDDGSVIPRRRLADVVGDGIGGLARLGPALRVGLAVVLAILVIGALIGQRPDSQASTPMASVVPPSFVKLVERQAPERSVPPSATATPAETAAALAASEGGRMRQAVDFEQPFARLEPARPKSLCKALREAGFDNGGWRKSEIYPGSFECASMAPDADAPPSPLFFVIRGPSERELGAAMLKTNAALATPEEVAARTRQFLRILSDAGVLLPPAFAEAVAGTGTAEGRSALGAVKAWPEFNAPERRIVSLSFARRLATPKLKATCADACGAAFADLRRSVPPVSVKSRAF